MLTSRRSAPRTLHRHLFPGRRYPVPQRAGTQGRSEAILGAWLQGQDRSKFVVATKVAGPGGMAWLRGGPAALDGRNIIAAIDGSLQRLGVDCIDLLQLHWPDR